MSRNAPLSGTTALAVQISKYDQITKESKLFSRLSLFIPVLLLNQPIARQRVRRLTTVRAVKLPKCGQMRTD